jgi:hypothetical protein
LGAVPQQLGGGIGHGQKVVQGMRGESHRPGLEDGQLLDFHEYFIEFGFRSAQAGRNPLLGVDHAIQYSCDAGHGKRA